MLLAEHGASAAINYRDSEALARRGQARIEEGGTAEVGGATWGFAGISRKVRPRRRSTRSCDALAAELRPGGVRVNAVAPGVTLTDAAMPMSPIEKERIAANCPLRRNGLREGMAGAVLFLASGMSRFMIGAYLPVDGGFTMS